MAATDFESNPTTTTTYDDVSYAAMISNQVKDALMATVVTPALLDFHDLSGDASKAVKIPKADKFTAAAVAEACGYEDEIQIMRSFYHGSIGSYHDVLSQVKEG